MRIYTALAIFVVLATSTAALATPVMLDLTSRGSSGFINGAEYIQGSINPAGTGVYEPFLRLQHGGVEQGFNTSAEKVLNNKAGIWTRDLLSATIPTVTVNGKEYREIRLDINESSSKSGRYLSLDSLKIYLQDAGGIDTLSELDNLVYSMDSKTVDYFVKLDYKLASGSGWDDMTVLLPEEIFSGAQQHPYFYLYSKFGVNYSSDAGFEEWAADPRPGTSEVPEPGTMVLVGAGLVGFVIYRRRKAA